MKFNEILKPLQPNILRLEQNIETLVAKNRNELFDDVTGFLFAKSKRLRPAFVFLCALALREEIDEDVINLALALELLHSATLVHDDILDEAQTRRETDSFNKKFGSKRAVIIGDYLLSLCLAALSEIKSSQVLPVFSQYIIKTVNGEINQFNSLFQFSDVDDYLNKSMAKTANLFICAAHCMCVLKGAKAQLCDSLMSYAKEFGTLFQLKNDLKDFKDDIKNGIFTLCAIYFKQENPTCDIMFTEKEQILKYVQKADPLIDKIKQNAAASLNEELEPKARQTLVNLVQSL